MGFHYTIKAGDDSFTFKCRYSDVELLCDLANKLDLPNVFAQSASDMEQLPIEITRGYLIEDIDTVCKGISDNSELLLGAYTYKMKDRETGKFGRWTTESWMSPILENKYIFHLEFGRRKACLNRREVLANGTVGYPEVTDLRELERFVLPEGTEIMIRKKKMEDTITSDLSDVKAWAMKMEAQSPLIVQSG